MDEDEYKKYTKCTEIEARLKVLYNIKIQITALVEYKGRRDYKLQKKKEQSTIMEICDLLCDMRILNQHFYQRYIKENQWAEDLMSVYDNHLFKQTQAIYNRGIWDSFE